MSRHKPQCSASESVSSTSGSSSSSSSSGSSTSSTSSDSSSSSDTENSSGCTRTRNAGRENPLVQESSKKLRSAGRSSKTSREAHHNHPPPPPLSRSRARPATDSEPESSTGKRGPKSSATIQKSAAVVPKKPQPKNVVKSHHASSNSKGRTPLQHSIVHQKRYLNNNISQDKESKKSLFSPDNSTDSDGDSRKASNQRKRLPVVSPAKSQIRNATDVVKKQIQVEKHHSLKTLSQSSPRRSSRRVSEKSSESSTNSSSVSSESDSECSSQTSKSSSVKSPEVPVTSHKIARRNLTPQPEYSESEKEDDDDDEEGKAESPRRHLTRSSSVHSKRSSLLGINKGTDSDSENGPSEKGRKGIVRVSKKPCTVRSTKKQLSQPDLKLIHLMIAGSPSEADLLERKAVENVPLPPIESRRCPVDGCNSTGHLGGLVNKHFTVEACPVFHNFTKEECRVNREVRLKDSEEHEKASASLGNKSPRLNPLPEQRAYCNRIRDSRDKMSSIRQGEEEMADQDRQPSLRGLTPHWDLQLFVQAQAAASEKTEDDLRGLPDSKGIRFIEMGKYSMEVWYHSQYPDDLSQLPKIYVCEYCLKYLKFKITLERHAAKCVWRHPPGDEIYRRDKLSVWEVDGKKYKTYCQNLCLLAMLFLDHKTLYYDVEPFLFYIMTQADSEGCHIIGYFSKEKNSLPNYNVSCIMTLPPYQRKGYGRILIDFSYLLTRMEGKIGSPEKPLSDLGLISYRSYWKDILLKYLSKYTDKDICIKDISQESAVSANDIVSTFQAMGMMKYWKGKHILLKRQDLLEEFLERHKRRRGEHKEIDPKGLNWRPPAPPEDTNQEKPLNVSERKK